MLSDEHQYDSAAADAAAVADADGVAIFQGRRGLGIAE